MFFRSSTERLFRTIPFFSWLILYGILISLCLMLTGCTPSEQDENEAVTVSQSSHRDDPSWATRALGSPLSLSEQEYWIRRCAAKASCRRAFLPPLDCGFWGQRDFQRQGNVTEKNTNDPAFNQPTGFPRAWRAWLRSPHGEKRAAVEAAATGPNAAEFSLFIDKIRSYLPEIPYPNVEDDPSIFIDDHARLLNESGWGDVDSVCASLRHEVFHTSACHAALEDNEVFDATCWGRYNAQLARHVCRRDVKMWVVELNDPPRP